MHDTTFALTVLALFTTAERAEEIEGDLLEQSRSKGRAWFWWQVKLTCIALFFHGLRQEGGKLLLLSYAIYELVLKLNWWALNPLRYALRRNLGLDVSRGALTNDLIIVFVAFAIGMLLVRLSARHGAQLVLLAFGFMLGRILLLDGISDASRFVLFALTPGLLGAFLVKGMELRQAGSNETGFPP